MGRVDVSRAVLALSAPAHTMTDVVEGPLPEEARHVRMLGCPDTRQFEVLELGYALFVREVATVTNPAPGNAVARLWLADVLRGMAVDVLKGNDEGERAAMVVAAQRPARVAGPIHRAAAGGAFIDRTCKPNKTKMTMRDGINDCDR